MDAIEKLQRAEIARQNKRRGKEMEKKVAKILKGNRVPMSGAGSIKGDCTAPLDEYRTIYVECKMTARKVENNYLFSIPHEWFHKIEREAKAMRSVFGILVIQWFRLPEYWVFMPLDKLHFLEEAKDINLKHWITERKETGELKKIRLTNNYTRNQFLAGNRVYDVPNHQTGENKTWIVVSMNDFVEVLHKE